MKIILYFYKKHKAKLLLLALLYGGAALCALFMPYEMSRIVTDGIKNSDGSVVLSSSIVMGILAVVALSISFFTAKINSKMIAEIEYDIRLEMFEKINSLSFEEFASIGTSSMLTRMTEDIFILRDVGSTAIYTLINVPITFIGGVILVITKNPVIGLIMLSVSPLVLALAYLIAKKINKLWERANKFTDEQNRHVRERLSGIRVLRAFDKEKQKHEKIAYATKEMVKSYIRSNILSGFLAPFASLLLNVATVAIIYFSSKHISYQSAFTAGDVIACVQYIGLILNGLIVLSWGLVLIPHVSVSSKRVRQVLELKGAERSDKKGEVLNGDLKIENLSFHYPDGSDVLVLKDITMSVKNGEKVGVIGGTGSGKSTLIKLLCGFYRPTSGNIYLGNRNYNSLDIADIRQSVSVALQKAMIFQGTLKENVTAFNDSVSDEEVQKIIEIAQLKEFVSEKEGGLYHELKQSGSNLSGGQKQRVNIARTIFKNASLYVFDDSFSALDYLTESKLRKRLNEFLAGKKQLIITQRIATAMKCDRIYVFDGGKCVNAGTHNELLNSSEIYRELYRSQLGAKV